MWIAYLAQSRHFVSLFAVILYTSMSERGVYMYYYYNQILHCVNVKMHYVLGCQIRLISIEFCISTYHFVHYSYNTKKFPWLGLKADSFDGPTVTWRWADGTELQSFEGWKSGRFVCSFIKKRFYKYQ